MLFCCLSSLLKQTANTPFLFISSKRTLTSNADSFSAFSYILFYKNKKSITRFFSKNYQQLLLQIEKVDEIPETLFIFMKTRPYPFLFLLFLLPLYRFFKFFS
ncbi:hypothetical protein EL472_02720 [Enterococcus faecalis]|nr:hypothetical protein [Enterococcus faecalis]EGO8582399.1 hypothetical protein [Enterococcus faecalis]KAA9164213.1 hypothetical protein F6X84_04590 [Enterococcus faecalis]PQB51342.1 hypothetical protein CUN13_12810 [Enterococcus faecalis]TKO64771.1 hypothetical protein DVY43_00640 [Enterococcus faecalis]